MTGWGYGEVEAEFLAALEEAGIPPNDSVPLRLDGKKHRYRIRGQRNNTKNGEYCVYMDERPAGFFKSYAAGDGVPYSTWCMSRQGESFSPEEKARYFEEARLRREQREKDAAQAQARAVQIARGMWEASTPIHPANGHGYLKKKKLSGTYGARQLGNDLIIPLMDGREVMTVQTIKTDGEKRFVTDAPKRGNFYLIENQTSPPGPLSDAERGSKRHSFFFGAAEPTSGGESDSATEANETGDGAEFGEEEGKKGGRGKKYVWVCEGFATGATLHELSGFPVVCAIDAGNIMPVVHNVRMLHPEWTLLLAPDWDGSTGNAGMARAFEVYEAFGVPMVPPQLAPGEGSDWNDLYVARGFEKAQAALREGLKRALADPELPRLERENLFVHISESTGRPRGTIENLECLLRYLDVSVRYNEIRKEVEFSVPGREYGTDNALNAASAWITSRCVEFGMPKTDVEPYLMEIASRNPYNPVMEWIRSAEWDGAMYIDRLIDTIETPMNFPDDLKNTMMRKWLISAVAAVAMPDGFAARGVLVLQGGQAIGKTSWFRRLIPPGAGWFGEGMILDPAEKDSLKLFVSHWIVELGELEGTFKKTDIARLKAFITRKTDQVRLPWARKVSEFPRRTVLCASVNQKEVLLDSTGNSRWWVIPCMRIDYKHDIDVQQVWAEAYAMFQEGEKWWLSPEEEIRLEEQNENFKGPDPIEDLIASKFEWGHDSSFPPDLLTTTEVLRKCRIDNPTQAQTRRAAEVLRKLTGKDYTYIGTRNARRKVFELPPPLPG